MTSTGNMFRFHDFRRSLDNIVQELCFLQVHEPRLWTCGLTFLLVHTHAHTPNPIPHHTTPPTKKKKGWRRHWNLGDWKRHPCLWLVIFVKGRKWKINWLYEYVTYSSRNSSGWNFWDIVFKKKKKNHVTTEVLKISTRQWHLFIIFVHMYDLSLRLIKIRTIKMNHRVIKNLLDGSNLVCFSL